MSKTAPALRPREHGAYAMLAFPVASGLVLGGVSVSGVAFALLAATGFLAHEAALVVLGRRGERIRTAAAAAARTRLAVLGGAACLATVVFVAAAPGRALAWAVPPALLAASVTGLVLAGGTRSLAGEILVAAAFASVHGPVAAAGAGASATAVPALVWAASFSLATLSVHALKARHQGRRPGGRGPRTWVAVAAPAAAAVVLVAAGVAAAVGHPLAAAAGALVPKTVLVLAVSVLDVHPRHLKRVGWSLVAADAVTLVVLAAAL